MKKVFSLVAVALLFVSVLFTACRDNASSTEGTGTEQAAPAQQAAPASGGSLTTPADTTKAQQAQ